MLEAGTPSAKKVRRDYLSAFMWLSLAAALTRQDAWIRSSLAATLPPWKVMTGRYRMRFKHGRLKEVIKSLSPP